jgi:hypothetical protein
LNKFKAIVFTIFILTAILIVTNGNGSLLQNAFGDLTSDSVNEMVGSTEERVGSSTDKVYFVRLIPYAQLGISPGEILFNKTNNNGTDITNDKSSDDQIAVDVITPMPGVNSTLIGRSTPTTGNLSIEASNNTGDS